MGDIEEAIAAIAAGKLVVYPTETVYGLGGDATDEDTIEAVFGLKQRDRSKPLSVAVASISAVEDVAVLTPITRGFMEAFLPGPVTVVAQRREVLPDVLTAGRDRVGVRVPDHPMAQELLQETAPLTATSANPSGGANPRRVAELENDIRTGVAAIIDGGKTGGTASTVVDVDRGVIHRRGANVGRVEAWLDQAHSP